MSCYEILGVDRKARTADIKKAYRRLARKFHPDLNPGDKGAEDRFKQISDAYETLSDPQKRRLYDRQMDLGAGWSAGAGPRQPGPAPWDLGSIFEGGYAGGFSDLFSEILGGQRSSTESRRAARRGEDITQPLKITFDEAMRGVGRQLTLDAESACRRCDGSGAVASSSRRPCPDCAGTGQISRHSGALRFASPCRRCEGEGTLGWAGCGECGGSGVRRQRETIRVQIPAGVDTGSRVRVAGKGRAGRNGGAPGDLYIITQVEPHRLFRRIGDNIHCTVPITVIEAALGTHIEVPTIDGMARIRIPPGTENGQKLRLRGKGTPSLRGTLRGDHYVEAQVRTPPADDERSRELLRELGKLHSGESLRRKTFS
jgi:molecular chaperone DnaJ